MRKKEGAGFSLSRALSRPTFHPTSRPPPPFFISFSITFSAAARMAKWVSFRLARGRHRAGAAAGGERMRSIDEKNFVSKLLALTSNSFFTSLIFSSPRFFSTHQIEMPPLPDDPTTASIDGLEPPSAGGDGDAMDEEQAVSSEKKGGRRRRRLPALFRPRLSQLTPSHTRTH